MGKSSDPKCRFKELSENLQRSIKLDHLLTLMNHIALFQHAKFSVPAKKEGYTVDDNARALVFTVKSENLGLSADVLQLQGKLLSFLLLMQEEDGQTHNLMDFSQRIIDKPSIGDHLGRVIWATGAAINSNISIGMKASARLIFDRALPWAIATSSLRIKAYACLGLCERLQAEPKDTNLKGNLKLLADTLITSYENTRSPNWEWFENILTYDKARLCQALLVSYRALGENKYWNVAETTLQFLIKTETIDGVFVPIGNRGWYVKGGQRAIYDQQPIEPGAMIEAITVAYQLNQSTIYQEALQQILGWFSGRNTKSVTLYDQSTGACYDGVTQRGLNENQGAESTLAFLLAAEAVVNSFKAK